MSRPERLPVSVSEGELHDIAAPESFETTGSFVVAITNHGRDAHVHLALSGELAAVAEVEEGNPHIERDGTLEVPVSVDPSAGPVRGALVVETGYGVESASVAVAVGSDPRDDEDVAVDERLGQPAETETEDGEPAVTVSGGTLAVGGLAALALVVAGAVAAEVGGPVVVAGALVVLTAVLAAAGLLLR